MSRGIIAALVTGATLGLSLALLALPAVAQDGGAKAAGPASDAGAPALSSEVRITIRTEPEVRADVHWGKTHLGRTPLDFMRPRDSGPMDLVVTKTGYLTVRTRAYTFDADKLIVRMTRIEDSHMIFGYRKPLPPPSPDGGAADGGVPSTPSGPTGKATQTAPKVPSGSEPIPARGMLTPTGTGGDDGGTGN